MYWRRPTQRPPTFQMDYTQPIMQGCVFAGLGHSPGTTRYGDSSAYGNTGLLTGYAGAGDTPSDRWAFDPYLRRNVLRFDGTDDYGSLGTQIPTSGPITIACWFKVPNVTAEYALMALVNPSAYIGSILMVRGATAGDPVSIYRANNTQGGDTASTSPAYSANTWTLAVGVMASATNATSYRNYSPGSTDATNTTPPTLSSIYLGRIGGLWGAADSLLGQISDPCIWSRTLSAGEIQALADPSNFMLSGAIRENYRRRGWVSMTTAGGKPWLYVQSSKLVGVGQI